jgi:ribosomal protein S18 acetylase RimI-like enzyme
MTAEHIDGILTIVEGLPEWFDEVARTKSIPIDIRNQEGFVALRGRQVCGFVSLYVSEGRLHIGWLAVERELQRQQFGSRLLDAAVTKARAMGISELATYTLGDSVKYAPYDVTRRFYRKCGFEVYKRAMTNNPGCPEEIWLSKQID